MQRLARARRPVEVEVSILYEADRLCNLSRLVVYWHVPLFQSSTRQTDFATNKAVRESVFYSRFQSSTRQTDFATAPVRKRLPIGGLEAIFAHEGSMHQYERKEFAAR